jgi:hypothetical protein
LALQKAQSTTGASTKNSKKETFESSESVKEVALKVKEIAEAILKEKERREDEELKWD